MLPNVASVNRIVTIEVNPRWCKFSQRTWKLRHEVRERRDWCNIQPLLQFGENSRCIIVFTSHNNRASDDTNITEELRKLTTAIRIDVYLAYRVANFTGYISIETCLPPRICVVCIRAHRLCNWAVIFCDFGERGELHIIDYDRECMHVSCATVNARRRPKAHEFVVARAMTCVFDYLFCNVSKVTY